MRRLIIIVEGDTEKQFIDKVLSPYLYNKGLERVDCFKIKHTKGGLTKYQHLKTDIINCIYESNVIVSTLIDFYALPKDFPNYNKATGIVDKNERISFLEKAIIEEIQEDKQQEFRNLIPYIQMHEFEALVFTSYNSITSLFNEKEAELKEIETIINTYPNPELINDSPLTAPSKRMEKLIKGYNKVIHGIMIIEETNIEVVLQKCPRFKSWVQTLIQKVKD